MPLPPDLADGSVCYLETIGRVTGKARVIEIWFAADGDTLYLLAGGRDRAHWVRNLRVQPRVRVRIRGRTLRATAEIVEGGPEDATARQALAAKYQGWTEGASLSRWARTSLPVALRLDAPDPAAAEEGAVPGPPAA